MDSQHYLQYIKDQVKNELVGSQYAPFSWDSTEVSEGYGMGMSSVQSIYWEKKVQYDRFEAAIHRRIESPNWSTVWSARSEVIYREVSQSILEGFYKGIARKLRNNRLHIAQSIIAKAWRNKLICKAVNKYNVYLDLYLSSHTNPIESAEEIYKSKIAYNQTLDANICDSIMDGEYSIAMANDQYLPVLRNMVAYLKANGITVWDPDGRGMTAETKRRIANFRIREDYLKKKKNNPSFYDGTIEYSSNKCTDPVNANTLLNSRLLKHYVQTVLNSIRIDDQEPFHSNLNNSSFILNLAPPPPPPDTSTHDLGFLLLNAAANPKHPGIKLSIDSNGDLQHEIVPREESTVYLGGTDPVNNQYAYVSTGHGFQYCKRQGKFMGECMKLKTHDVLGKEVLETVVTGYTYSNDNGSYTQIFYGYNELEQCLHERWVVVGEKDNFPHLPPLKNEAEVIDLFKKIKRMKKKRKFVDVVDQSNKKNKH
ncbi:MAG: hypothetical protein HOK65_02220 [Crocinitomicaceae bacterium]|jgi:hypothetical protein|nr:hypothetical protein [Crocinitomicaceae bacterium]